MQLQTRQPSLDTFEDAKNLEVLLQDLRHLQLLSRLKEDSSDPAELQVRPLGLPDLHIWCLD
jgi:hypothetical protein